MQIKCPKCSDDKIVKNGQVFGWQRYKCKNCKYQFTKQAPAGKPLSLKLLVHLLHISGLSMREIASIVGVSAQSVSRWIKKWHGAYMSEIGKYETLYKADINTLLDCLSITQTDDFYVSSRVLPSGAKFNIVVQLPPKK
ncbi:MAG: IS1 family transposase [Alphaproteobacteria bacterium]|nr:IS1 family transposase [Alphaproteobacteria bacterium]